MSGHKEYRACLVSFQLVNLTDAHNINKSSGGIQHLTFLITLYFFNLILQFYIIPKIIIKI